MAKKCLLIPGTSSQSKGYSSKWLILARVTECSEPLGHVVVVSIQAVAQHWPFTFNWDLGICRITSVECIHESIEITEKRNL